VALEEIGVPYEHVWVGTEADEVERLRRVAPLGRVPALTLPDGAVMFESAAILIHLALLHPDAGLAPPVATGQHAKFLQWMVFLSANVYEAVLRIYYADRYSVRGGEDAAAIREQSLNDFSRHLELLGRELSPYLLGSEYSIADVYLYMLSSWHPAGKDVLFSQVPALRAHAELLARRPALSKVEAEHAA
jgi:glutathione S-transferase